jgi:hypothetical protein
MTAIPATYAVASRNERARDEPPRPPKILMVIGIIGYTHGVSEVRKPAVNANRKA